MTTVVQRTTFLVTLGPDGQWKWSASLDPVWVSKWHRTFPPDSTPRWLVDMGPGYQSLDPKATDWPWKVVNVQELYLDDFHGADHLLAEGWGAISYQWGEFLPKEKDELRPGVEYKTRPVYPDRAAANLPKAYAPFNASPQLTRAYDWGIPLITQFNVTNIKSVFKALGTRFVWWDGACIPQRDFSRGFEGDTGRLPEPYAGPPPLYGELGKMSGEEVGKQKFVYLNASVGALWLDTLEWTKTSALQKVLLRIPAMVDVDTVRTMVNRETRSIKTEDKVVMDTSQSQGNRESQRVLQDILRGVGDGVKPDPPPTDAASWLASIQKFVLLVNDVRFDDAWFRSLWSFQEGRLLKEMAFVDKVGNTLKIGSNFDKKGNRFKFPKTGVRVGDEIRETYSPGVNQLTAITTLLATQISIAYTESFGAGAVTAIPALVELWKTTEGKKALEAAVRGLICSGILYHSGDSPLELIVAARRTRFPSLFYRDEYFAVTGVLGLYNDGKTDYSMVEPTGGWGYSDEAKNEEWLYDYLPKAFFKALVKRYQWLALMLAKREVDDVYHWGAISMGHFETINPYCENIYVQHEINVDRSDWGFVLPQLEYLQESDELKLTKPAGSRAQILMNNVTLVKSGPAFFITAYAIINDWGTNQMKLWTLGDKESIPYVDDPYLPNGKVIDYSDRNYKFKPSNNVLTRDILPKELGKVSNTRSDKGANEFVLIPIESLGYDLINQGSKTDPKKFSQRCMLVTNLILPAGGKDDDDFYTGVFGGIVDVKDLVVAPVSYAQIRLKWQKGTPPPKPKPADPTTTTTPATTTTTNGNTTAAIVPPKPPLPPNYGKDGKQVNGTTTTT